LLIFTHFGWEALVCLPTEFTSRFLIQKAAAVFQYTRYFLCNQTERQANIQHQSYHLVGICAGLLKYFHWVFQ